MIDRIMDAIGSLWKCGGGVRIQKGASQHDEMIATFISNNVELAVEISLDHWALQPPGKIEFTS